MAALNYDKIKCLVYTEKSNKQMVDGKYHFRVDCNCNKNEVASLIKKVFNVEVEKVNVINVRSKTKKFKGVQGAIGSYKKAIVTLKDGQSINLTS
jgi:large subunit ribosomal protein L23